MDIQRFAQGLAWVGVVVLVVLALSGIVWPVLYYVQQEGLKGGNLQLRQVIQQQQVQTQQLVDEANRQISQLQAQVKGLQGGE